MFQPISHPVRLITYGDWDRVKLQLAKIVCLTKGMLTVIGQSRCLVRVLPQTNNCICLWESPIREMKRATSTKTTKQRRIAQAWKAWPDSDSFPCCYTWYPTIQQKKLYLRTHPDTQAGCERKREVGEKGGVIWQQIRGFLSHHRRQTHWCQKTLMQNQMHWLHFRKWLYQCCCWRCRNMIACFWKEDKKTGLLLAKGAVGRRRGEVLPLFRPYYFTRDRTWATTYVQARLLSWNHRDHTTMSSHTNTLNISTL